MDELCYAVVRITRALLYDDHPSADGVPPDIWHDTKTVVFDYESRTADALPVIRTYTAQIAVPRDRPTSWELSLGDDYRLLVVTEKFVQSENGVTIDGRIKSNYQIQLDPSRALVGPNAFHLRFCLLPVGESAAVGVLDDECAGRIFREYQEIEVEAIVDSVAASLMAGIEESVAAQQRRWDDWSSLRKSSLR